MRQAEPFGLYVTRAEGSHKWDADGHELICYVMGHGALLLGHSNAAVVDAVRRQATLLFHPGAGHELEVDWAELVVELVPSAEQVRFTSSGTEASMLALRLARAATGRGRVVKLAGHFHGWNDQVAFGADPPFSGPDTAGLPPGLEDAVTVVPAGAAELAEALRPGDVAAVILEPSGAAWGTVPLPEGFLAAARRLTREAGTVLVFDEVISGFRWSPGGVQAVAGVTPDLTVLGKIVAGGMPGGAVAGSLQLMGHLGRPGSDPARVAHPGTHNAHPLCAAAGIAALSRVRTGEPQRRADALASALRAGLSETMALAGVPGCAYGESSTFHLLIGTDGEPAELGLELLKDPMERRLFSELHNGMLQRGVHLFHGSGFLSEAHTERDVELTVEAFAATLASLPAGTLP